MKKKIIIISIAILIVLLSLFSIKVYNVLKHEDNPLGIIKGIVKATLSSDKVIAIDEDSTERLVATNIEAYEELTSKDGWIPVEQVGSMYIYQKLDNIMYVYTKQISSMFILINIEYKDSLSPPEVIISCGDTVLEHTLSLNTWDGANYDRQDSVIAIMSNIENLDDIPYFPDDSEIVIQILGAEPSKIIILDLLIKENGHLRYDERAAIIEEEYKPQTITTYTVSKHWATGLSSHTDDYKPKSALRGIKIVCDYGLNQCEYAFVYRSDP